MKAKVFQGADQIELADKKLRGARLGLMTNPTGVNRGLQSTIDVLHEKYNLTALIACEHGVRGDAQAGAHIATYVDPDTGVTVYSSYGSSERIAQETLDAFDVFVFDIQEVGSRFYTYLYSLSYAMEACHRAGKPVVVLDRLNPIGGVKRGGTIIDPKLDSFVGAYELPTQYGLTMGEYARYVKDYLHLNNLDLTIVPLQGWQRKMYLDDTDLPWIAPSPNCQALSSALCFTATCIFEGTNLSEGRGTTMPFELIGAPWIDARALEARMAEMKLPGVHFRRAAFTPVFSKNANQLCFGVQVHVTDRETYRAFDSGLYLLEAVKELHPDQLEYICWSENSPYALDKLMGIDDFRLGTLDAKGIIEKHAPKVEAFSKHVQQYLLYE